MKVIFLDIDGVLNSTDYMNALHINYSSAAKKGIVSYPITDNGFCRDKYGNVFDPRCTLFLEAIINDTDAKIVISSTWRLSGLQLMQDMWKSRCLAGEIIGITKSLESRVRGEEIKLWLKENQNVSQYVIIDDDCDMLDEQQENFVKTSNRYGIDAIAYNKIVKILNN